LGAKLFGIAALAIAVIALVPVKLTDTMFDFYVHDTYIVVAARHAIFGFALLCGVFAGFYYFGDLALGHRLNHGLTLAHFLLWIFSLVVFALEAQGLARTIRSQQDPNQSWLLIAGFAAPLLAFIAGGILFLVNLAWAIVLKLKTP
jgi:heme/copper-type cytochrome/quinol oxidase subunit 1